MALKVKTKILSLLCSRCSRSAVYRTREMAARALVPFVLVTDVPSTIRTLLEDLPVKSGPGTQQNHIHGTLLQVCVIEKLLECFIFCVRATDLRL